MRTHAPTDEQPAAPQQAATSDQTPADDQQTEEELLLALGIPPLVIAAVGCYDTDTVGGCG